MNKEVAKEILEQYTRINENIINAGTKLSQVDIDLERRNEAIKAFMQICEEQDQKIIELIDENNNLKQEIAVLNGKIDVLKEVIQGN